VCTQKNPLGFFGYVPGCLNPETEQSVSSDTETEFQSVSRTMQPVVRGAFSSNLILAWTQTKAQVETAQPDIGIRIQMQRADTP